MRLVAAFLPPFRTTPSALGVLSWLLLAFTPVAAAADPIVVGVITSRSGAAAATGSSQALAATAWASRVRAAGGVFGVPVQIVLADDESNPRRATEEATRLIAEGVHVLVCCTTSSASRDVAGLAEAAGVPLLSPSSFDGAGRSSGQEASYWSFDFALRESDALAAVIADAHRLGAQSVALMTLNNAFGDETLESARALAAVAGLNVAAEIRYPPGTRELRPEALWVATRQPGAVIVWGLADDLEVAVSALRRRGYVGPVYARSALLAPGYPRPSFAHLAEVRFAVAPALVQASLASDAPCAEAATRAAAVLAVVHGGIVDLPSAAPVIDALELVEAAVEQVIALQLPDVSVAAMRQALRDGLVALPERCGALGIIDLVDGRSAAVVPRGLAISVVTNGGLVSAR
ncbi:MAG: ABC transporter substrate-binding protein [Trueperaceae bacterium]